MVGVCRIVDPERGLVTALPVDAGEAVTVGAVEIAAACPEPNGEQPSTRLRPGAYAISDRFLPRLMRPVYRRNLEDAFGHRREGGVLSFVRAALRS